MDAEHPLQTANAQEESILSLHQAEMELAAHH